MTSSLSAQDFEVVMSFIVELMSACPVLIEKMWDLYLLVIEPYVVGCSSINIIDIVAVVV